MVAAAVVFEPLFDTPEYSAQFEELLGAPAPPFDPDVAPSLAEIVDALRYFQALSLAELARQDGAYCRFPTEAAWAKTLADRLPEILEETTRAEWLRFVNDHAREVLDDTSGMKSSAIYYLRVGGARWMLTIGCRPIDFLETFRYEDRAEVALRLLEIRFGESRRGR